MLGQVLRRLREDHVSHYLTSTKRKSCKLTILRFDSSLQHNVPDRLNCGFDIGELFVMVDWPLRLVVVSRCFVLLLTRLVDIAGRTGARGHTTNPTWQLSTSTSLDADAGSRIERSSSKTVSGSCMSITTCDLYVLVTTHMVMNTHVPVQPLPQRMAR